MANKVIHMIWIGDKEFPFSTNLRIWQTLNPYYDFKIWHDKNLPKLICESEYKFLKDPTAKADLLRLEILYQFGGIYTDVDTICLKPIDETIGKLEFFGMTGLHGAIANGFLGCPKNHPAFKEILDKVPRHFEKMAKSTQRYLWSMFRITGTRYITPILKKYDDFVQLPRYFFCDFPEVEERTTIAHIAHGYNRGHKKINMKEYLKWM